MAESTSQATAGSADHPRENRRVGAHDTAVGMPSDEDMGNSEAGHKATVERTKTEGAKRVRIHILLDGRDLPETSALDYVEPFEALLTGLNGCEPQLPDRRGGRHPPLWRCSIRMSTSTASSSRVSPRRILQERRRFTQAVRPTRSGSTKCRPRSATVCCAR